jgi:DNA-binding response OmpR family regulator
MTRRLLIVDDYPHVADMLAWLLGRFGYDIRIATDAFQALGVAAEFRPEIVLLDIGMPDLNGFETAKRIRKESWGAGIVLIAISGHWTEEYEQMSREAGFDAHARKPFQVNDIVNLMDELSRAN